ncbi:hydantoinase B/oxoprolinase family protein [Novosphingobium piscinae]|uniref:Hydantoinase B/oxoprolinase family protein n=1 Tax=Novosphingobium piscinae TaxID=1507448 RepID=A0A7X1FWI5_9SPHN|nr:hydantoinase B/oxoprolinase family protein [Novosphingobium piscinae]MBC2667652.1 hydantoinase B/oxoprolinase family protein [Novosphingobium piscinae]
MQADPSCWHFWVDRGGTFTDVVARAPDGRVLTAKLLSENPGHYADAAIEAMHRLTGMDPLPPLRARIGTTVATNALLERRGEPTCLAITRGFGDALAIGYQERPSLFVRRIDKPAPLYAHVAEITERIGADGSVVTPLDEAQARASLAAARARGIAAVAIVLMHGYRFTRHEERLAAIAADLGFTQISVSHRVAPLIKLIGRGDTTLVDAYLSPVLRRYVDGLQSRAGDGAALLFMQSSGGLTTGPAFRGKDAILSGPAGGIVGLARTAQQAGFDAVIGFDMGGTSTDVSHFAGHYERDSETMVAGVRVRAPIMRIHTVAAGGGSICAFDGARLTVGPRSAGAVPGPAAYRRGGPLTVTDCNVLLGKIVPHHFPAVFGPAGDAPLDTAAVAQAFAALSREVTAATGEAVTAEDLAEGFIAIAVANMANAIKTISVQRGHDVSRYTLGCFGGAGGQHACLVAEALGMSRVMIHPMGGVLSAFGMGLADRSLLLERTLGLPLAADQVPAIAAAVAELAAAAEAELRGQGAAGPLTRQVRLSLRHDGTDSLIAVEHGPPEQMIAAFHAQHRARFGFTGTAPIIVDTLHVEVIEPGESGATTVAELPAVSAPPREQVACHLRGTRRMVPLYERAALAAGFAAPGPAIIVDAVSTTVVEPGWSVAVDRHGNLLLERDPAAAVRALPAAAAADPVRLEIMGGLFMAIAEEMGAALQHSASSVNIRERLDFSCALFDGEGHLVANAPHMPVHLGSMGESVRTILRRRGGAADGRGIRPGDVYALNAPYEGGTHLPDVTVIMPVFVPGELPTDRPVPRWFVAARGHHADIGGISPGSMPPDSRSVEEEGILLDNVLIVEDGRLLEAEIAALLSTGPWPSRNVAQNLADLKAQVAACARGAAELNRVAAEQGADRVSAAMRDLQAYSEAAVRKLIGRLNAGTFCYPLDNGAEIRVDVRIDRAAQGITFDFTGTSAQLPGNFNAPLPVVRAAVLYVVRTLIDEAVPMNEGCLRPVTLRVPEGSMLSPRYPAAVVAGNVETSQAVTDALFGALGTMAAAQGTMNNLTFGNARHQYYETIAGGAGAGPGFAGADVVQTHMTNSRLTDPEILETRFPVRLEAFAIRPGSGGAGAFRGGNGAVRRLRFLAPMRAGILSNRRRVPPFGLAGGAPGAPGRNSVERAGGAIEPLGATAGVDMEPGDVLVIETPGGGGYGAD